MSIFDISFFGLHIAPSWYGAMYAFWFIICYFFLKKYFIFHKNDDIDSLVTYVFLGIILGWRAWYIILYDPTYFLTNPVEIFSIWKWGMSFHGWLLGTIISVLLYCKKYRYKFWELIDTIAVIVPIAIWLWRLGNWINQELPWYSPYYGIFPMKINWINHFPSPLFEMLLEGIILFVIMILSYVFIKNKKSGTLSWIFLIWYGSARIFAEFFRLPDTHIGYILWTEYITMWILYTIPMILSWVYILYKRY